MTAPTAITINRSVARIGVIPFLDVNFLTKAIPPFDKEVLEATIFNMYEL